LEDYLFVKNPGVLFIPATGYFRSVRRSDLAIKESILTLQILRLHLVASCSCRRQVLQLGSLLKYWA